MEHTITNLPILHPPCFCDSLTAPNMVRIVNFTALQDVVFSNEHLPNFKDEMSWRHFQATLYGGTAADAGPGVGILE